MATTESTDNEIFVDVMVRMLQDRGAYWSISSYGPLSSNTLIVDASVTVDEKEAEAIHRVLAAKEEVND